VFCKYNFEYLICVLGIVVIVPVYNVHCNLILIMSLREWKLGILVFWDVMLHHWVTF